MIAQAFRPEGPSDSLGWSDPYRALEEDIGLNSDELMVVMTELLTDRRILRVTKVAGASPTAMPNPKPFTNPLTYFLQENVPIKLSLDDCLSRHCENTERSLLDEKNVVRKMRIKQFAQ